MTEELNDEQRIAISAVVHQNYYMPDVFTVVASLLTDARAEGAEKALLSLADDLDPDGYGWRTVKDADRFRAKIRDRAAALRSGGAR